MTEAAFPRCGHRFNTNAVSATRCRQCEYSVRVGTSSNRSSARDTEPNLSPGLWVPVQPGWGLAGLGVIGFGGWALYHAARRPRPETEDGQQRRERWRAIGWAAVAVVW
jgi:hypothetical protein